MIPFHPAMIWCMHIANFSIKWLIYIAFIHYSAMDQARSIKFGSKYV